MRVAWSELSLSVVRRLSVVGCVSFARPQHSGRPESGEREGAIGRPSPFFPLFPLDPKTTRTACVLIDRVWFVHVTGNEEAVEGDAGHNSETAGTRTHDRRQLLHECSQAIDGQVEG